MRRHRHRAGARSAGQRDAGAALPHPHPQPVGRGERDIFDIGRLREQRVMLDRRAVPGQIHRLGIRHQEDAMRIAHAHRRRRARDRQRQRVRRLGQRDLGPVELRRSHVDRGQPAAGIDRHQQPALGQQRQPVAAGFGHQMPGDAAGGIAAGGRSRAVGVEEAQPRIGIAGGLDHHQLVEADAAMPVAQRPRQRRRHHGTAAPLVDDHEVVAQPVHFHERQGRLAKRIFHQRHILSAAGLCQNPTPVLRLTPMGADDREAPCDVGR